MGKIALGFPQDEWKLCYMVTVTFPWQIQWRMCVTIRNIFNCCVRSKMNRQDLLIHTSNKIGEEKWKTPRGFARRRQQTSSLRYAGLQVSAVVYMRPSLFQVVTQSMLAVVYRRLGTTHESRLGLLDLWRCNRQDVPKRRYTKHPRRAQTSADVPWNKWSKVRMV